MTGPKKGGAVLALAHDTLLVDEYMPEYDFTRMEHLVIGASVPEAYAAARNLDLLSVHTPMSDAAMFVRGLPARVKGLWGEREQAQPPPSALRLADLFDTEEGGLPGWIPVAEEKERELVFGAVGRFWQPDIEWRTIPRDEFAGFGERGWGKIAASLSFRQYGTRRTLVTYEARTRLNDEESRRKFRRYWLLVSPFVGVVMRAFLDTVAKQVRE